MSSQNTVVRFFRLLFLSVRFMHPPKIESGDDQRRVKVWAQDPSALLHLLAHSVERLLQPDSSILEGPTVDLEYGDVVEDFRVDGLRLAFFLDLRCSPPGLQRLLSGCTTLLVLPQAADFDPERGTVPFEELFAPAFFGGEALQLVVQVSGLLAFSIGVGDGERGEGAKGVDRAEGKECFRRFGVSTQYLLKLVRSSGEVVC